MAQTDMDMYVVKRNGQREPVQFDKVLERIRRASKGLSINATRLAQLVLTEIHDNVQTTELDELAARLAISFTTTHPDWGTLASRIIISNCQKNAPPTFHRAMEELYSIKDTKGNACPAISTELYTFVDENATLLNMIIKPEHDYLIDYFGYKTLERAYLMRNEKRKIVETPQYMWLRVAIGIWGSNLDRIQETYRLMSTKAFTHATPTLFNAGTPRPQLSSCFLVAMKDDSIDGIFDTLKQCAQISKYAGGIGLHVHNIRAQGSFIAGTQGTSNGLVPMLRVFNNTARYVDQGGGRRNGSFAIYLEPWHADIQSFLKMKSNTGSEEERARDLFYALWVPDLFMKRVETDQEWSLFCPHEAPGLAKVYGNAFEELYIRYEKEGRARRTISAQKLWSEILVSQIETGTPYLLYKDAANMKSNQQNLGTIQSSNLCVAPETMLQIFDPYNQAGYNVHTTKPSELHCVSVPIHTLEGQEVHIWNGNCISKTIVHKTGLHQSLLRVVVFQEIRSPTGSFRREFSVLECTFYHKFILFHEGPISHAPRVEAHQLEPNMPLYNWYDEQGNFVFQKVFSVENHGRCADTYCFTEPIQHAGIFNGILTGNCTEILEYSSPEETAVCNLASIALPYFITNVTEEDNISTTATSNPTFDFALLRKITGIVVRNLNRIIDINYYPTPETRRSNFRHRPIGIGVQGLADVFSQLKWSWEMPEAAELNREIFENMYYAAMDASIELAKEQGVYESFAGSPLSQGKLQPDLWNVSPKTTYLDWEGLRMRALKGARNSLLLAPMPTASTSQILGYNECIEPFTTNIYVRRTLAGEFTVLNRYLVEDLVARSLWSAERKERIVAANGSIQAMEDIPLEIRQRFKTVWELKQKTLIDMAADRAPFICQSQSLNLFVQDPTIAKLSSMHFYGWRKGLKTGIYYLRTKSAVQAIKFTVDPTLVKESQQTTESVVKEECLLCSS